VSVTLVVTGGNGSMDLYSSRLAEHLDVPVLLTDAYQQSSEIFNTPWWSGRARRSLSEGLRFWSSLRRVDGAVHLPNHHLGRFALGLPRPFILTVHDLIRYFDLIGHSAEPLIHRPRGWDRALLRLDYRAVRRAAKVIAPSDYTKQDLVRSLGLDPGRIEVIQHGVDSIFSPRPDGRAPEERYVLYVGSEHPRKNLPFLLRVFKELRPSFPGLKLVKVGRAGGGEADFRATTMGVVRQLGLETDVIFRDFVSQEELVDLYRDAAAFCFPSLYEGFGWPPLEAMACGCPVVASSTTAVPEVVGDGGRLCPPDDAAAWVGAIGTILEDPAVARELRERGLARARQFSWQEAARKVLAVYRGLDEH
jgi:glycosyltransferase involved in cell wall biosynthesis